MTTYMKAMGISHYHQKTLETFTIPVPTIADDEVLVEVHAGSEGYGLPRRTVFPLADAQETLDYSQSGRAKGKIVLKVR